jgi:hypothetical protein
MATCWERKYTTHIGSRTCRLFSPADPDEEVKPVALFLHRHGQAQLETYLFRLLSWKFLSVDTNSHGSSLRPRTSIHPGMDGGLNLTK